MSERIGRNDPCPCGSGVKFKKCKCHEQHPETMRQAVRQAEEFLQKSNVFNSQVGQDFTRDIQRAHDETFSILLADCGCDVNNMDEFTVEFDVPTKTILLWNGVRVGYIEMTHNGQYVQFTAHKVV